MTSRLAQEFLEEHRHLTRGLYQIREALEGDDLEAASRQAEQLDRLVGAHMEFEEQVFYPELVDRLGGTFVSRLYEEHEEGQTAVKTLLTNPAVALDPTAKQQLLGQVQTALDHAISCGTLLSHIGDLDPVDEERVMQRWHEIHRRSPRWTELPARSEDA
jgi:hypothetical protein